MAITLVQAANATRNSSTSFAVTFAGNITAGNTILVCVAYKGSGVSSMSPSSGGDIYTSVVNDTDGGAAAGSTIWSTEDSAGGYTGITVNLSGAGGGAVYAYEVSGVSTTDVSNHSNDGGTQSSNWTSGSVSTNTAAEFWVGIGNTWNSIGSQTIGAPGGSWTNESKISFGSSNDAVSGYQITSATGSAVYNSTVSANSNWSGCVATFYNASLTVSITVAQVNINTLAVQPPVFLTAAQVTQAAQAFSAVDWALALSTAGININSPAIAPRVALTLLAALAAKAGTDDSGASVTQGFNGKTTAFTPNSNPLTFEVPHNMPAMSNSWAVGSGGQAKYLFDSNGNLEFAFILNTVGTTTDATTIWGAGSLPSGYRPPIAKYWPVVVIGSFTYANETPSILFGTDGSIKVYGISSQTPTSIQAHGVLPLNI